MHFSNVLSRSDSNFFATLVGTEENQQAVYRLVHVQNGGGRSQANL